MSAAHLPRIEHEVTVRFYDTDCAAVVHNLAYLRFIEEARVAWFRALVPNAWADVDCAPILAAATVNYRRPIGWPERVRVTLHAERLGTKSLTLGHRIESATVDGVLYADGHTVMVWVDRGGTSIPLPPFIRHACE